MKSDKITIREILITLGYIVGVIVCIILISVMVEYIMGEIGTIKTLVENIL